MKIIKSPWSVVFGFNNPNADDIGNISDLLIIFWVSGSGFFFFGH